ncbi:MAG TPA: class I SAM-dependent methyltransferase [Dehalococcoidia bacterium]|nr:class I SAM-dependent methyltransferase [Dehalococcoidia bacterium]
MINVPTGVEWGRWKASWEARMSYFVPDRPGVIRAMLDALEVVAPPDSVVLDLGSGPGSLAGPLLDRFPRARCLAVDLDPVLLALGQATLTGHGDRLRWERADLRGSQWADRVRSAAGGWARPDPEDVAGGPFDAILTLSALHHLASEDLIRVYRQAAALLRPGGVLINGDFLPFGPDQPTLARIADQVGTRRRETVEDVEGHSYADWWDRLRAEPGLAPLFEERDRSFPPGQSFPRKPLHDLHQAALRDAGFGEIGTIWQNLDKRVLLTVRSPPG